MITLDYINATNLAKARADAGAYGVLAGGFGVKPAPGYSKQIPIGQAEPVTLSVT